MSVNAGFSIVACFSEQTINQFIGIYYANLPFPIQIPLETSIPLGNTTINIRGNLTFLCPTVTLKANPSNLVEINIAIAGHVSIAGGPQPVDYDLILASTINVGLLAFDSGDNRALGLDLSTATVNSVDVYSMLGSPLDQTYVQSLNSPIILESLNFALRNIPVKLQITPPNIPTSLKTKMTYQPLNGSLFEPRTLFSLDIPVSRIIARPLDAALVVGCDFEGLSNGNPEDLVDLNNVSGSDTAGYMTIFQVPILYDNGIGDGPWGAAPMGRRDIAVALNGEVLSAIVNNIIGSQIAAEKPFVDDIAQKDLHVRLERINMKFDWFSNEKEGVTYPGVNPLFGAIFFAEVSYVTGVGHDEEGYLFSPQGGETIHITTYSYLQLIQYEGLPKDLEGYSDHYSFMGFKTDIDSPILEIFEVLNTFFNVLNLMNPLFYFGLQLIPVLETAESLITRSVKVPSAKEGPIFFSRVFQTIQLPGTSDPDVDIEITDIFLAKNDKFNGVYGYIGIDPYGITYKDLKLPFLIVTDQDISDPDKITSSDDKGHSFRPRDPPIGVVLKIPVGGIIDPQDSSVFVEWKLTRLDMGVVLLSKGFFLNDGPKSNFAITIDHGARDLFKNLSVVDTFHVSCKISKPVGPNDSYLTTHMLGRDTSLSPYTGVYDLEVDIQIVDWYDRHHPYVWWEHTAFVLPGQKAWPKHPSHELHHQAWFRDRISVIHRTDVPGRCAIMDKGAYITRNINRLGPPRGPTWGLPYGQGNSDVLHYIDDLAGSGLKDYIFNRIERYLSVPEEIRKYKRRPPSPYLTLNKIKENRKLAKGILCDYCFYGGPSKNKIDLGYSPGKQLSRRS